MLNMLVTLALNKDKGNTHIKHSAHPSPLEGYSLVAELVGATILAQRNNDKAIQN